MIKRTCNKKTKSEVYKCDQCDYEAQYYGALRFHSWKHSGKKEFTCEECDWSTTRVWGLRKHMESAHAFTKLDLIKANLYSQRAVVKLRGFV